MKNNIVDDLRLFKSKVYGKFTEVNAEVHVTYDIKDDDELVAFVDACKSHDIKMIGIDLMNGETHVMTSERIRVPLHEIPSVIKHTLNDLWKYRAIRFKVETDINCMTDDLKKMVTYYESHINCDISTLDKYNYVGSFVQLHNYKISRNIKKDIDEISITKRYDVESNDIYDEYNTLVEHGIAKTKLEIECVIFDSNIDLDANW